METSVGGPGAGILTLAGPTSVKEFLSHEKAYFEQGLDWKYFV